MIIDCLNFNRLIEELVKLQNQEKKEKSINDEKEKNTARINARALYFGYVYKDGKLIIGYADKDKKPIIDTEKTINKLTKFSLSPHTTVLIDFYDKEDLLTNPTFIQYVELVYEQLINLISYESIETYCRNLFTFISPFHGKEIEYTKLKEIIQKKHLTPSDIKTFLSLVIIRAIRNIYRTDEKIALEAYDMSLGLKLLSQRRIPLLKLAGQLGMKQALYDLAMIFYDGVPGIEPDYVQCYHCCLESDHKAGLWSIGWMYQQGQINKKPKTKNVLKGDGTKPDYRNAIRFYLLGTTPRYSYAKSYNSLGNLCILASKGVHPFFEKIQIKNNDFILDELESAEWYYIKAAQMGDIHAVENLAGLYLSQAQNSTDEDEKEQYYSKAFNHYSIAAEAEVETGNSINRIGEFYLNGLCKATPKDHDKAEICFRQAIQVGGSKYARLNLAKLILEEKLLKADIAERENLREEAIQLLKEAVAYDQNKTAEVLLEKFLKS